MTVAVEEEILFDTDGSCRLIDIFEHTERSWETVEVWAADWSAERRSGEFGEFGDANEFIDLTCYDAVPGVVDALVALAERRSPALRTALASVLLGAEVPDPVRTWWEEFHPRTGGRG